MKKKRFIQKKFSTKLLLGVVIVLIMIIGVITFLQTSKKQMRDNELSSSVITPPITLSPTSLPTFTPNPLDNIDWDTTHWKTYTGSRLDGKGEKYSFSIKYPPTWNFTRQDDFGVYYPFGISSGKDVFEIPRILLGTGGHGGPPSGYSPRSFQAGQALYGWNENTNNTVYAVANFRSNDYPYTKEYIFEIDLFPVKNAEEADTLKRIFEMMLNTFTPLNN